MRTIKYSHSIAIAFHPLQHTYEIARSEFLRSRSPSLNLGKPKWRLQTGAWAPHFRESRAKILPGKTGLLSADFDTEYDRAKVPPYNGNDPPPAPGSLKRSLFPTLLNEVQNKGTQGVRARYGAELPPIISIVRYPGRPVILGMDDWSLFVGPTGAFSGLIETNSSAPHSRGETAEIPLKGPFLDRLAYLGPSPRLLSPRLDFCTSKISRDPVRVRKVHRCS